MRSRSASAMLKHGCAHILGSWVKARLVRANISSFQVVLTEDIPGTVYVSGTKVTVGAGEWKPCAKVR